MGFHDAGCKLGAKKVAGQVDIDDQAPVRDAHLLDRSRADDAGIGHQNIQTSKLGDGLGDHGLHLRLVGHVDGNWQAASSRLLCDRSGGHICLLMIQVGHNHVATLFGQAQANGSAQSLGAASHKCNAIF